MKRLDQHLKRGFIAVIVISMIFNTANSQNKSTVKDLDGNIYKTIEIGNQTWMAENLKTTKYNDGTSIPLVTDKAAWILLSTPAFCLYNNDTINKNLYGALYNGYAVNSNKICPTGWHVSKDSEWQSLVDLLGGSNIAGGKLKTSGTDNWIGPNTGANNESGFTALPGGTRYNNGLFFSVKTTGYWWSFTKPDALNGWYWSINYLSGTVTRNYHDCTNGFSVRCVKD